VYARQCDSAAMKIVTLAAGALVHLQGDEELRVSNQRIVSVRGGSDQAEGEHRPGDPLEPGDVGADHEVVGATK